MLKSVKSFINQFDLICDFAINDFKTKYIGSGLGIVWAFVQPLITIVIYWIVFEYCLKVKINNISVPYAIWFITGMVPWFFFSDALGNGTNCLKEYNYLVKKVLFPVEILPLIKVISSLFVHLVFVVFLMIVYFVYGIFFDINIIQVFYYIVCLSIYTLVLTYISSTVVVFFKDIGQIINIILQIGIWISPIMWQYTIVPSNLVWLIKLNPLYYIVEGYRQAFFGDNTYPWTDTYAFVCFWGIVILCFWGARIAMKKMEPHFADVL